MDSTFFYSYKIEDRSHLSYIKRHIHSKVMLATFEHKKVNEIDIVVSELTSNLIKHARSGEILFRLSREAEREMFEIISIDNGAGISNVAQMMKDGVSTVKTLGQGLGAIERLSDHFQIYSAPGWGTIAYVRVYSRPAVPHARPAKKNLEVKCLSVPKPGEVVCGDGCFVKKNRDETQILLGDGLGHGEHAHAAVEKAIESFQACQEQDPAEVLRFIHEHVKRTRGLVGTVASWNHKENIWRVCGIGNIMTRIYSGREYKSCISYNGIIGMNIPNTLKSHEMESANYQYIAICSDGIQSRWDLAKYPALLKYDATIWAAMIYKDFSRGNDDTSVLIGKITN